MHASLPALAAARAAHIAAACLHTPCIAERRLPLGPARKPEATRVRADQDHLFRGGPWHALSSLARAHARVPAHLSTRPVTAQPSCVPERLRTYASTRPRQRSSLLHASLSLPVACPRPAPRALCTPASMRPGGLGSSSPASAAHRSLRDRRENHLNSTTIKPGLHFGKPGRSHSGNLSDRSLTLA